MESDAIASGPRPLRITRDRRNVFVVRYFYFLMSLVIAGSVAYGFSLTIDNRLIHPPTPRPLILYVHAVVFIAWVPLFVIQTALVQLQNVRLHRQVGLAALGFGVLIPAVGVATALVMTAFKSTAGVQVSETAHAFLIIPLNDMVCFSVCFALAVWRRKSPEYHRRLMYMSTCCLTAAAFARLPFMTLTAVRWYGGVDLLILLGMARDLYATGGVHPVYKYGVPLLVVSQALTMTTYISRPAAWLSIAYRLVP